MRWPTEFALDRLLDLDPEQYAEGGYTYAHFVAYVGLCRCALEMSRARAQGPLSWVKDGKMMFIDSVTDDLVVWRVVRLPSTRALILRGREGCTGVSIPLGGSEWLIEVGWAAPVVPSDSRA